MARRNAEVKTNGTTKLLSSEKITKGVAAFQEDTPLLQENKIPEFSDEAATVYMQFSSHTVSIGGYFGRERLPHPLSYDRSVCLYLDYDQKEDVGSQMSEMLRSIGVTGDIKVMCRSEMQPLVDGKDTAAIAELAESYDCHLTGTSTPWLTSVITPALHAERKMLCRGETAAATPAELRDALGWTAYFTVPGLGHLVKVGHTGMTAEQITENIEAVLERFLKWNEWFPRGREHFESIKLKTGLTDGVAIYVNPGEVVPEPWRKPFGLAGMRTKSKPREKRKAPRSVDVPTAGEESNETPAAKKKKKNMEPAPATETLEGKAKKNKKKKNEPAVIKPVANGDALPEVEAKSPALKKKKNKRRKGGDGVESVANGEAVEAAGVQLSPVGEKMKKKKKKQQKSVAA